MTKPQTLRRYEKVNRPGHYRAIISRGRRVRAGAFVLYFKRAGHENSDTVSQLGIIVSKRVLRKAHDRVRVKRLLREVFRQNKAHLKHPVSLVFRLAKKPNSFEYKEIETNCIALLERCGLM